MACVINKSKKWIEIYDSNGTIKTPDIDCDNTIDIAKFKMIEFLKTIIVNGEQIFRNYKLFYINVPLQNAYEDNSLFPEQHRIGGYCLLWSLIMLHNRSINDCDINPEKLLIELRNEIFTIDKSDSPKSNMIFLMNYIVNIVANNVVRFNELYPNNKSLWNDIKVFHEKTYQLHPKFMSKYAEYSNKPYFEHKDSIQIFYENDNTIVTVGNQKVIMKVVEKLQNLPCKSAIISYSDISSELYMKQFMSYILWEIGITAILLENSLHTKLFKNFVKQYYPIKISHNLWVSEICDIKRLT